ncbi:hypothetical protein ACPEEZ_01385 [Frigoribacterium sp. 2-23]|uniref:hypothetical protein n=1 Tax=Frigoribacterium sp. 2-23 TaxID=3415006 RepID=UPI003C6F6890
MPAAASSASSRTISRARRLSVGVALLAAFVALYAFSNRTALGQSLENSWARLYDVDKTLGHHLDFGGIVPPFTFDIETLVAGVGAAVVIALVRRRWRAAVLVAVAMPIVVLGTSLFKQVAGRPELVPSLDTEVSYPSGHAGIALVVTAALLIVAPPRLLGWCFAVLGAWCLLVLGGLQAEGQHRASEVIGSSLLTAAVIVLVDATTRRRGASLRDTLRSTRRPGRAGLAAAAVAAVAIAVIGAWCPVWWPMPFYAAAALLATALVCAAALLARDAG